MNNDYQTMLLRGTLFGLVWWILANGAVESWQVGVPVVLVVTIVSMYLMPPLSWSLPGLIRFIPFFIVHSIRGGVDVAKRAFHPQRPIAPALFDYRFRLPPGYSRVFMANAVSLLPGTLSVQLSDEILHIHVLDEYGNFLEELKTLENQLASVFGIEMVEIIIDDIP